jgi:hypothetical protein
MVAAVVSRRDHIMMLRVGNTIINLENVMLIEMRGGDRLEDGEGAAEPYLYVLEGDKAEAVRKYLRKLCPDLLGR